MSVVKNYTKTGSKCRVTFKLNSELARHFHAEQVVVVGDFCDWAREKGLKMKVLKDGSFSLTTTLPSGRDYHFKYLINDQLWENDEAPDDWVNDGSGNYNSLLHLEEGLPATDSLASA